MQIFAISKPGKYNNRDLKDIRKVSYSERNEQFVGTLLKKRLSGDATVQTGDLFCVQMCDVGK